MENSTRTIKQESYENTFQWMQGHKRDAQKYQCSLMRPSPLTVTSIFALFKSFIP